MRKIKAIDEVDFHLVGALASSHHRSLVSRSLKRYETTLKDGRICSPLQRLAAF